MKNYIRPTIESVCLMEEHCLLETISLGTDTDPAGGGGDAKQGYFDETEEESWMETGTVWDR